MRLDFTSPGRLVAACLAAAGVMLSQASCLIPVRSAPGAEGLVVDAESGRPVAGAIVVVRFETWYDDVLPDRELLAHRESRSDPGGRFAVGPVIRPGLAAWPLLRTEARVVAVMADGYRCPAPQAIRTATTLRLTAAHDLEERRDSCRPVPAERREASAYMQAWRALFPPPRASRESREQQRELERLLAARSVFGFGENCAGPVLDLALDPSGRRTALVVAGQGGSEIQAVELGADGVTRTEVVSQARLGRHERLAWTSPTELVLWEPATQERRMISGSIFGSGRFEVLWTAPTDPSSAPPDFDGAGLSRALDPTDLNDEGDARWMGRSFRLRRDVHPATGLPLERLEVTRPDGSHHAVDLPGEACGPRSRFGRPHYRIAADGGSALDLRFVDGGCHAVRIDLQSGAWAKLDAARGSARCQQVRSVPAQHMSAALRGYMREVTEALETGRADPGTAYALHVDGDGGTTAVTRDLRGTRRTLPVPRFPLATPLKRIEVTLAGGRAPTPAHGSSPALAPSPL